MAAHYTEAQDQVILDGWALVPAEEIGRRIGKPTHSVIVRAQRMLGLPRLTGLQPWTPEEDRYISLHWGAIGPKQLAADLSRTVTAVMSRAGRRYLDLGRWSRGTMSLTQMADHVGWHRTQVMRAVRALHLPTVVVVNQLHLDILTAERIAGWLDRLPRFVVRLPKGCRSLSAAARELGVGRGVIQGIIRREGMEVERVGKSLSVSAAQFRVLRRRVKEKQHG